MSNIKQFNLSLFIFTDIVFIILQDTIMLLVLCTQNKYRVYEDIYLLKHVIQFIDLNILSKYEYSIIHNSALQ